MKKVYAAVLGGLTSLPLVWILSCSFKDYPYEQVRGRDFSDAMAASIRDGSTSRTDVISMFGKPTSTSIDGNKTENLAFVSVKRRKSEEIKFFVKRTYQHVKTTTLHVYVNDGIVRRHHVTTEDLDYRASRELSAY